MRPRGREAEGFLTPCSVPPTFASPPPRNPHGPRGEDHAALAIVICPPLDFGDVGPQLVGDVLDAFGLHPHPEESNVFVHPEPSPLWRVAHAIGRPLASLA